MMMTRALRVLGGILVACGLTATPAVAQLRPGAFTTVTTTSTSVDSLHVGCAVGASVCTGGIVSGPISASTGAFSSDVAVNTNKFTVTASSGNTAVAGNFAVNTTAFTASSAGLVTITPTVVTSGSPTILTMTGAANTTLAAGTEAIDVNLLLGRTVQYATGAIALQRAVRIGAPLYSFVGASTITTAATLYLLGPPVASTNATITNSMGLRVQALAIGAGVTNGYGVYIEAPTGAANNYAALFSGAVSLTAGMALDSATPSTHGIVFGNATPSSTTLALYYDGSSLVFSGNRLTTGNGNLNTLPKFANTVGALANSLVSDDGSNVTLAGAGPKFTGISAPAAHSYFLCISSTGLVSSQTTACAG